MIDEDLRPRKYFWLLFEEVSHCSILVSNLEKASNSSFLFHFKCRTLKVHVIANVPLLELNLKSLWGSKSKTVSNKKEEFILILYSYKNKQTVGHFHCAIWSIRDMLNFVFKNWHIACHVTFNLTSNSQKGFWNNLISVEQQLCFTMLAKTSLYSHSTLHLIVINTFYLGKPCSL